MILLRTATNNILARSFFLFAGFETERRLAPWVHWRFAADWCATFAAAVRVIVRVHDDTADFRTLAQPACAACFTDFDQLVIFVAYGTDRCAASFEDAARFAGAQTDNRISVFLTEQLCFCTSSADQLAAFARLHLDVVDNRTDRNVLERQCITRFDVGCRAGHDLV